MNINAIFGIHYSVISDKETVLVRF